MYPASESYAIVTRDGTALVVPTIDAAAVVDSDVDPTHVVCPGAFTSRSTTPAPVCRSDSAS